MLRYEARLRGPVALHCRILKCPTPSNMRLAGFQDFQRYEAYLHSRRPAATSCRAGHRRLMRLMTRSIDAELSCSAA